jgi:hypothetical protein
MSFTGNPEALSGIGPFLEIEYLNKIKLVDDELQLAFIKKDQTSAPDNDIPVYRFQMINVHSLLEMGEINIRAGYTENIEFYPPHARAKLRYKWDIA